MPFLSKLLTPAALLALLAPSLAPAQSATNVAALKKQIDQLQTRITRLEEEKADSKDVAAPADTSASKIKLGDAITELKLYGDIRGRYQYDDYNRIISTPAAATGAATVGALPRVDQRDRWRLRLRIGADVKLGDQFFGGVTLATGLPSDSNNQTLTEGYDNYSIYVDKAFVGWSPSDWLTAIFGKQANPFYTTDLVWDPDITPSGFVETLDLTKAFLPDDSRFSLQVIALQGAFFDNNEYNVGADNKTDAWQFAGQLKATFKFSKTASITIAPGYMTYTDSSLTGLQNSQAFSKPQDTLPATATTPARTPTGETRDLSIITAPGDISFRLGGLATKFYWDFAYNTEGSSRATNEYFLTASHQSRDDIAWLIGLQLGQNTHGGDWSIFANYRQIGIDSIDPNLNDSDFGLSFLNITGLKVGAAYNFTDAVVGAVTYMHSTRLRSAITGGEATGGAQVANAREVDVLQVDLLVKF